jgi:hypothetical protein
MGEDRFREGRDEGTQNDLILIVPKIIGGI